MKKFFNRMLGFSIGPLVGAVISFITVPLTTYFISPAEFGKSAMFTMTMTFFNTFVYLGMDQAYAREYHETEDKNYLFFNSFIIPLIVSIMIFMLTIIFRNSFSFFLFGTSKFSFISILFGICLIFYVIERFILMNLRMQEKAFEYSFFSIVVKITILFALGIMLLMGGKSFLTIVYSTIMGQIVGDIYLLIKYRSMFLNCNTKMLDKRKIKQMLIFGMPLLIAVSVSSFLNTIGTYSIRYFNNFHDLGIYTAGQRISGLITIIQTTFTTFWVPTSYRWYKENKGIKNYQLVSDLLLLFTTLGFFLLIFLKKWIVLLISNGYSDAQYIVGFLVLIPIFYTVSETTTLGIVFSKKSYLNIIVSVVSVLVAMFLSILLTPLLSFRGASISIAIAYFFFFSVRSYFSKKNQFNFPLFKHYFVFIIYIIVSLNNLYDHSYIVLINVSLLLVALVAQSSTFRELIKIKNHESEYDLN